MFGFNKDSAPAGTDVISVLTADHRKVDALFAELEAAERGPRKIELATQICHELVVHATAEEQIFYPQALAALQLEQSKDVELIWEATVEHGTLEGLIGSLTGMSANDEDFDAHMKVLKEYVKHHVKEEENEIFPRVRRTSLDLEALGEAITQRKQALEAAMTRERPAGRRSSTGGGGRGRGNEGGGGKGSRGESEKRSGTQAGSGRSGGGRASGSGAGGAGGGSRSGSGNRARSSTTSR